MEYSLENKYLLIKKELLESIEKDPIEIVIKIMKLDFINIHGPEHHFLDGASLLVAMKNAGLEFDLESSLDKLAERTVKMPGAMCGYWGICGSVSSVGAALAVLDNTGPLSSDEAYANHMKLTSKIISRMSEIGGPRCCKRNAFISLGESVKFVNENYGLKIPENNVECKFSKRNLQCINNRCPFHI